MHPESVQCQTKRLEFESLFSRSEYSQFSILNISYFFLSAFWLKLGNQSTPKIVTIRTVCMSRARFVNTFSSLNRFNGTCGPNLCIVIHFCFVNGNEILPNCYNLNVLGFKYNKISFCIKYTTGIHMNAHQPNISFVYF